METDISVCSCENYEYGRLKAALLRSFENLGGVGKFINKGDRVLLKVNLVMKKKPEDAATSNPEFVAALSEILIEHGAEVIIGDSPGGLFNDIVLQGIYKTCGMSYAAEKSGAKLNHNTGSVNMQNPRAKKLKTLTVTDMLNDVDKVISVSRLKAHGMTRFTAAVKNMFGTVPGTIKAEYHFNCPDVSHFAELLVDICLNANPVLSFIDAITAMEGNGPTAGTPRDIGVILAGESPYTLDLAASRIISAEPSSLPTLKESIDRGLCPASPDKLNYIGDDINSFVVNDFKLPEKHSLHFLGSNPPKALAKLVNLYVQPRPTVNQRLCIGCGDCARNCPAKTIYMESRKPKIGLENCIRCFCCQELCPKKAIDIKHPKIFKLLSKL